MSLSPPSLSVPVPARRAYSLAIAGCGHILRSIYRPILLAEGDGIEITAVCDPQTAAREEALTTFPEATAHDDLDTLLRAGDVDAVLVLASETAMTAVASRALQAPVAIYLEKPPALNERELDTLLEAEARGPGTLYLAFNRRYTPLFQGVLSRASAVRSVRGRLSRLERRVENFPYTAIHLLDAVHYFSGQAYQAGEIEFGPWGHWRVRGTLSEGAEVDLEIIANGEEHSEYLILTTDSGIEELYFPNPEGKHGRGRWLREGQERQSPGDDALENMGYAPCLRGFLAARHLPALPPSGLENIRPTIRLMEAMATLKSRTF